MASNPIIIPDNAQVYSKEQLVILAHYDEDISSILIPSGQIADRVEKLSKDIFEEYQNKDLHFLCVLKGAFQFFSDISHYFKRFQRNSPDLQRAFSYDFIRISSYEDTKSTGDIKILATEDLKRLAGKDVLIIEDIVDSGKTMCGYTNGNGQKVEGLLTHLEQYNPSSVKVATLLLKRTPESNGYVPNFIGFSIPQKFVVGYGLDYNEHLRDIDHICIISQTGEAKYKKQ